MKRKPIEQIEFIWHSHTYDILAYIIHANNIIMLNNIIMKSETNCFVQTELTMHIYNSRYNDSINNVKNVVESDFIRDGECANKILHSIRIWYACDKNEKLRLAALSYFARFEALSRRYTEGVSFLVSTITTV